MAKCFRCGKEISQQKCGQCGYDLSQGIRLVNKWNGVFVFPTAAVNGSGQTTTAGVKTGQTAVGTGSGQTAAAAKPAGSVQPTREQLAAWVSQAQNIAETRNAQTNTGANTAANPSAAKTAIPQRKVRSIKQIRRQIAIEEFLKKVLIVAAALAVLVGLFFGGRALIGWLGIVNPIVWKLIVGGVAGIGAATAMIIATSKIEYWLDQLLEMIAMPLSVVNLVMMIIFPEVYGPVGALLALGLGAGFAYLSYELFDYNEASQGAACAVFMIADLLLFPHIWGVSVLGYILYGALVLICVAIAFVYVGREQDNPVALQIICAAVAAVVYLAGFLCVPHLMHAMHQLPEIEEQTDVDQKKLEADCFCGDTIEVSYWVADQRHAFFCGMPVWPKNRDNYCDADKHWTVCKCGTTCFYQKHEYDENGNCRWCDYLGFNEPGTGESTSEPGSTAGEISGEMTDTTEGDAETGSGQVSTEGSSGQQGTGTQPGQAESKPAESQPAETKPAETQPPTTAAPTTAAPTTEAPTTQAPTEEETEEPGFIVEVPDAPPMLPDLSGLDNGDWTVNYDSGMGGYLITGYSGTDEEIEIPGYYLGEPVIIGEEVFEGNTTLRKLVINEGVTQIGNYAFSDCVNLQSVSIPGSVKTLWYGAFRNCTALTEVTIAYGVENIEMYAFSGCSSLKKVELPNSVRQLGANALMNCTSLESVVLPSGLTELTFELFYGCTSLKTVEIPAGVTNIQTRVFGGCTSLTAISIPENVSSLETEAFAGSGLTEIYLPPNATSIGDGAFKGCDSLRKAEFYGEAFLDWNVFEGTGLTEIIFHGTEAQFEKMYWPDKEQYRQLIVFTE